MGHGQAGPVFRRIRIRSMEDGFMIEKKTKRLPQQAGFTLIEIMMVVVILVIAALAVVPMLSSGASVQVEAAADMLAADLEYAKSMAISHASVYRVVFNVSQNYYQIQNAYGTVISHPVKKGQLYTVDFDAQTNLNQVQIDTVDFNGTTEVRFDYIGSPYDGDDNALNTGSVTLTAGESTAEVTVEPVTGLIKVSP